MAKEVVQQRGIAIRMACQVFSVSESCYRYESRQNAENEEIANWLLRLTDNHRNWGFGLCYLYLRNVKNFGWNHKRIYRIYRELELNLRIKPRRRLVREKPEPLAVPQAIRMAIPRCCTASLAISRLRDGLATFLRGTRWLFRP